MTFEEAMDLDKGTIVYGVEGLKVSDDNVVLDSTQFEENCFFLKKEDAMGLVNWYLDYNKFYDLGYNIINLSKNVVADDGLDEIDGKDFKIEEEED